MKRGKKYKAAKTLLNSTELNLNESLEKVPTLSTSKFDGKIEAHISLNMNEKERKQPIRGTVIYEKPVGKAKRVLVFADPANQEIAKKAGADYYGLDDLIEKIKGGWAEFDVAIATPSVMSKIAVLGRVLGTKGLMPNPKSGTVTEDIKSNVEAYKGGKLDYKSDDGGVIHSIIGTSKTPTEELRENFVKLVKSVIQASGKSEAIVLKSVYLTPSMGPSVKINIDSILKEF